jgi:hypothetical protein
MSVRWLLAGIAVLFAAGITWGLPGGHWAPDELTPRLILDALDRRFSGGWFDKYPPLHYYVLAAVDLPVVAAARLGVLAPEGPAYATTLHLANRLVSVAMGLGTALCAFVLARRFWGPRAGLVSAGLAAAFLPMPVYAKLANLDVPFVFWFALSLVFYARLLADVRRRDLFLFALTATLSICTKDQAYGLFVLPGIHAAVLVLRAPGKSWRSRAASLAGFAGVGIGAFVLCHNLLFNASGFIEHVRALVGPASADYRMYPPTPNGQLQLAVSTMRLVPWMLGWPGMVLVATGILVAARPHANSGQSATAGHPAWLLLPALSYYVFFIAVVGYVYDRFLLPISVVLAVFGGAGAGHLLSRRAGSGVLRPAVAVFLAWIAWRAVSVDLLMLFDSRYGVEEWLRTRVEDGAAVAWTGQAMYLPRLHGLPTRHIQPSIDATLAANPAYIVANAEYAQRYAAGTAGAAWWNWLQSGDSPYELALRRKTRLSWSALSFEPRLWDGREDPFTNVDKINPEIVVFRRR